MDTAGKYILNFDLYEEQYSELAVYLVGIDYLTYHEDAFHFNGVNYRMFVLGKENGQWRVLEQSDAPLGWLTEDGFSFGSEAEAIALDIEEKRMQGFIVNADGELLSTNGVSESEAASIMVGGCAAKDSAC